MDLFYKNIFLSKKENNFELNLALLSPQTPILLSLSNCPFTNLSLEKVILDLKLPYPVIIVYLNKKTVVMGRFQNPYLECSISKFNQNAYILARRFTGGGTVYHDDGNLNFSFISPIEKRKASLIQEKNLQFFIDGFKEFNLEISTNPKMDLLLFDKKISGSAFKLTDSHHLHHMTLLVSPLTQQIKEYLEPSAQKYAKLCCIKTKAVRSRPGPVTSLQAHIDQKLNYQIVLESIFREYIRNSCLEEQTQELQKLLAQEQVLHLIDQTKKLFQSPDWIFAKTPHFEIEFFEEKMNISIQDFCYQDLSLFNPPKIFDIHHIHRLLASSYVNSSRQNPIDHILN